MQSRVLLASYDGHLLQAARQALKTEHIEPVIADDGNAALCLLNETLPDVLIADIALPGKDGYALCQYVRQEPEFESLPVVLLDRRFDANNRENAFRLGADVYLSQPFAVSELIAAVRYLLESREGSRQEDGDKAATAVQTATAYAVPDDSDMRDGEGMAATQDTAQVALAEPAWESMLVEPRLPSSPTVPPRRHPLGAWMFVTVAAVVMLIGIALAILLRPHPTEVQGGLPQPEGDHSPPVQGLTRAGEAYASPVPDGGSKAEAGLGVLPPLSDTVKTPPAQDPDAHVAQAAPSAAASSPSEQPTSGAGQPRLKPATVPAHQSSPAPSAVHRPPDTPAPPRRNLRSRTPGYHWHRSGQEIVLAGEHFGSSAKHFGKGSAKTVSWTGKQAGNGIKRIGRTLKGIF
jgi:CheY-like chemotaxis protein